MGVRIDVRLDHARKGVSFASDAHTGTMYMGYPHGISTIQKPHYSVQPVGPDELDRNSQTKVRGTRSNANHQAVTVQHK